MHLRRTTKATLFMVFSFVALQWGCRKYNPDYSTPDDEWRSGGSQTVFDQGSGAFSHAFNNLSDYYERIHEVGDAQFNATFVSAPAPLNPGLGPIFNNVSCISCHINDGRGKIPGRGESAANMLFRISLPGEGEHGNPVPVPGYGDQIGNRALRDYQPEADVSIAYTEEAYTFSDGSAYSLRKPEYTIIKPYTAMPGGVMLSPRVAVPIFGVGLLEAIPDEAILAREDPDDRDGDGISGKANYVWNILKQAKTLGRFGWKANQPSLIQQTAAAYVSDMGITNSIFRDENNGSQTQQTSDEKTPPELKDSLMYSTEFYIRTLAVPGRRNADQPQVLQGKALFLQADCAKCHIPDQRTAVNTAFPPISNQLIHPYTDLLLHDMGEGLADNRPDYLASGREWRTAPLWGIGLTQKVNNHTNFLHDGRARNLLEAILWHGGEAESSKETVRKMSASDREALLAFLNSL
ncbi:CxxC motif-containing protein, DUF1111 family [bacterium A37T11]|nr:CxxC motif-containing protein, DUF1111 family [bacterium A37T11]